MIPVDNNSSPPITDQQVSVVVSKRKVDQMLNSNNNQYLHLSNKCISVDTNINRPLCCYKGCFNTDTVSRTLVFIRKPVFLCLKHRMELEKCDLIVDELSN